MPVKQGDPADGRQQSPAAKGGTPRVLCPPPKLPGSRKSPAGPPSVSHWQTSNIVGRRRWNLSPLDFRSFLGCERAKHRSPRIAEPEGAIQGVHRTHCQSGLEICPGSNHLKVTMAHTYFGHGGSLETFGDLNEPLGCALAVGPGNTRPPIRSYLDPCSPLPGWR